MVLVLVITMCMMILAVSVEELFVYLNRRAKQVRGCKERSDELRIHVHQVLTL